VGVFLTAAQRLRNDSGIRFTMSATYPAHFRKTHHAPILSDQRDFGRYVSGFITPTSIWGLDLLQIGQTHNDKGIRTFVDAA
jgi:hypothetical protein